MNFQNAPDNLSTTLAVQTDSTSIPTRPPGKLNLLVTDDVMENLELLEEILADYGYHILLANNAQEALELLQANEVHLIVADAMMPKMDGFQLCKTVKSFDDYAHIPFVIYTGDYVDREDVEFAQKIGVDRYVMKTGGLEPLIEAVNDLTKQVYGFQSDVSQACKPQLDDHTFLEHHNAVLVKKLEQKMVELEMYAETLAQKNRALEASEARYRGLFEHASIAIIVLNRNNGKITDVNKQGVALLGFTKNELLSLEWLPFIEDEGMMDKILQSVEYTVYEAKLRTYQGEALDVEIGTSLIDQPRDERAVLFIRDVTEQKQMREQMLQVEKMSLMGWLVSGVAHEIRNPLAAATLHLQYLMQKYKQNFPDLDSVEAAFEGTQRIQHIIEKTLSLARPTPPVLSSEYINDVVERALWFVKMAIQQKNLKIETIFSQHLPTVLIDAKQIQQVILNIVQNAIEASPQNAVIHITTGMSPESLDRHNSNEKKTVQSKILVTVRDHGAGISKDQIKHLFEPFRTTKPAGTGLGLALSKHIMDRHAAEIQVKTAEGGGTAVYLLFPMIQDKKGANDVQR